MRALGVGFLAFAVFFPIVSFPSQRHCPRLLAHDDALTDGDREFLRSLAGNPKHHETFRRFLQSGAAFSERDRFRAGVMRFLQSELQSRSDAALSLAEAKGHSLDTDLLVVGGGYHAAVFNATFAQSIAARGFSAQVVTVSASERLAPVFAENGGVFSLNGGARHMMDHNPIPGGPVAVSELFPSSGHPFAQAAADAALLAQYFTPGITLLGTSLADLAQADAGGSRRRFHVKTSRGIVVHADLLILATGMGEGDVPEGLRATKLALAAKTPMGRHAPIETFDEFFRLAGRDREQGASPLAPFVDEDVLVAGAGDGGCSLVEFLLGEASGGALVYGNADFAATARRIRLLWAGQKARSGREFLLAHHGLTSPASGGRSRALRFEKIAPWLDRGALALDARHLRGARQEGKKLIPLYDDGEGPPVDRILLATGRKTPLERWIGTLPFPASLRPLLGKLDSVQTALALELHHGTNGRTVPLYVIGAAAGALAEPHELVGSTTWNPFSLEVSVPRTAAFAYWLADRWTKE